MRLPAYLLGRTLLGVLLALAVVSSVVVLVDLVEVSRTVGIRGDVAFAQLLELTLLKSPAIVLLLLPFVFLFGSMATFTWLNRGGELIAMRAAGVSAWQFILPPSTAAFVFGLLSVGLLHPLAAAANSRFEDRRAFLTNESSTSRGGDIWLREGGVASQTIIRATARGLSNGEITLKNVSIFVQTVGAARGLDFTQRIDAEEARLIPGHWRLSQARETRAGSESVRSEILLLPSTMDRQSAMEKLVAPNAVAIWALPATIKSAETAGYSSAAYRLRLHQLAATPTLLAAMTMLAATFCLRLWRLGDLAALASLGVSLGFGFFIFNQFCGALGIANVVPAAFAAWIPPLLALLTAMTILFYTEDG